MFLLVDDCAGTAQAGTGHRICPHMCIVKVLGMLLIGRCGVLVLVQSAVGVMLLCVIPSMLHTCASSM